MIDTKEKPVERVTERPAKAWRNKWNTPAMGVDADTGRMLLPGPYWGNRVWPSKETAEQAALEAVERNAQQPCPEWMRPQYLGAFPVTP